MLRSVVITFSLLMTLWGCGSSTPPVVNDPPRPTLPADNSADLIGTEGHPCDTSGGCFNDLICEDGICVAPPVVDAGSSDGSSDGSSTGNMIDSGSSDGSSDGSSTGDMIDSGSSDGSSDGSSTGDMIDSGSSDGGSTGEINDSGSSDGNDTGEVIDSGSSDGSSDGMTTDAGMIDNLFRYVENADFETVDPETTWPASWIINTQVSTEYNLISGTDSRGNIMEIDRPISTVSGHWAFMQQTNVALVDGCSSLILSGDVQPMNQSLNSPGYSQGEFPIHIRIVYEDADAQRHTYQLGVYYAGDDVSSYTVPSNGCASHLGTCNVFQTFKVAQNEWFTLPGVDLMTLTPAPHKLVGFRLGSSGHTFKGRFDNVQLTGSDAASCGLPE